MGKENTELNALYEFIQDKIDDCRLDHIHDVCSMFEERYDIELPIEIRTALYSYLSDRLVETEIKRVDTAFLEDLFKGLENLYSERSSVKTGGAE